MTLLVVIPRQTSNNPQFSPAAIHFLFFWNLKFEFGARAKFGFITNLNLQSGLAEVLYNRVDMYIFRVGFLSCWRQSATATLAPCFTRGWHLHILDKNLLRFYYVSHLFSFFILPFCGWFLSFPKSIKHPRGKLVHTATNWTFFFLSPQRARNGTLAIIIFFGERDECVGSPLYTRTL
jgi:hypothetical protein